MRIDYRFVKGEHSGLWMTFYPATGDFAGRNEVERTGPDIFSVHERAFVFIEGFIGRACPVWHNSFHHWGLTWLPTEIWREVLSDLPRLRTDVRGNVPFDRIVGRYVPAPALLGPAPKFHRKALLDFLDGFEQRIEAILERYPYVVIGGV